MFDFLNPAKKNAAYLEAITRRFEPWCQGLAALGHKADYLDEIRAKAATVKGALARDQAFKDFVEQQDFEARTAFKEAWARLEHKIDCLHQTAGQAAQCQARDHLADIHWLLFAQQEPTQTPRLDARAMTTAARQELAHLAHWVDACCHQNADAAHEGRSDSDVRPTGYQPLTRPLILWNRCHRLADGGLIDLVDGERKAHLLLHRLRGHRNNEEIVAVAFSADGTRALSGGNDRTLMLWDLTSGKAVKTLRGHQAAVSGLSLNPEATRAVSSSYDKTLILWDVTTGQPLKTLRGHDGFVYAVAMNRAATQALSGSFDQTLILWDLASGQPLHTLEGHTRYVMAVALSADGTRALSGSYDRTLILWDLSRGRALRRLSGHQDGVRCVALSADGTRALSGSIDHTAILWDLNTGQPLRVLQGHSSEIWGVALSADGNRALTGSDQGFDDNDKRTLIVWDLNTGEPLHILPNPNPKRGVHSVAFSADATQAIAGSSDGTLTLWGLGCA